MSRRPKRPARHPGYATPARVGRGKVTFRLLSGRTACRGRPASGWEKGMPKVTGFAAFASVPEERITDKVSRRIVSGEKGMIVWWSIAAGVHVDAHQHPHEQIVWMLKG